MSSFITLRFVRNPSVHERIFVLRIQTSKRQRNNNATMVRFSCQAAALLLLAAALPGAESFSNNGMRSRSALRRRQTVQRLPAPPSVSAGDSTILYALPTAEESAKALSDYMAKSHEDKLRAVKDAETKKNAEIQVRTYKCQHLLKKHNVLAFGTSTKVHLSSSAGII